MANLSLARLVAQQVHARKKIVRGQDAPAPVGPAVNPALPKIRVGKEALPPAHAEQGRISKKIGALVTAGLHAPKSGIKRAGIRRSERTIKVPQGTHLDFLLTVLVEETAEAESVHIKRQRVED